MDALLKAAKEFPQNPGLDQTFAVDSGLISEMVGLAGLRESDVVLEIGAGLGFITQEILKAGCKVIAVEKDPRLLPGLEKIQNGNLKIIPKDFTDFPLPDFTKMISNVPFNSLEALMRILAKSDFEKAILITPLDFAKKMTLKMSGPLSFFARNFFDMEIAREIPQSSFYPAPKIKSAILVVSPLKLRPFFSRVLLRGASKLKNALIEAFCGTGLTKNQAREKISGIEGELLDKKVSELSLDELVLVSGKFQ